MISDREGPYLLSNRCLYNETDFSVNVLPKTAFSKDVLEVSPFDDAKLVATSQTILDREKDICNFLEKMFSTYIGLNKSIDQKLNIYSSDFSDENMDIIDFTEYKSQADNACVFEAAYSYIKSESDINLLWSTNEYVWIKYQHSDYLIKRKKFDIDTKTIEYQIIGYETWTFVKNANFRIPVYVHNISLNIDSIIPLSERVKTSQHVNTQKITTLALQAIRMANALRPDDPITSIPAFDLISGNNLVDMLSYCKKYIDYTFKSQSSSDVASKKIMKMMISSIISNICIDYQGETETDLSLIDFMRQKISTPFACVALTNKLITEGRLSKPISKSTHNTRIYDSTGSEHINKSRKVRNLNGIKITSSNRPIAPTVDRIIRYTTAQWGRKGHLRKYKSGKVIEIKPTTVKRKCMSTENATVNIKTTHYKIH